MLASILYFHVCLSRSRLCHALCPLWACACRSLGPLACVVASVPPVDCLGVTTCEIHLHGVGLLDACPFSTLCDVMLALLVLCHPFGFLCIFAHLPTCSCMSLCVVYTPISWNCGHLIQTYICPFRTLSFVCPCLVFSL